MAHGIADPRQLDLNHVRAEIGKKRRAEGTRDHGPGIDDLQPAQRPFEIQLAGAGSVRRGRLSGRQGHRSRVRSRSDLRSDRAKAKLFSAITGFLLFRIPEYMIP